MTVISDGKARRIAAEWHGGQASMLCSLATTGFIGEDTLGEVEREIAHLTGHSIDADAQSYAGESRQDLRALAAYLEHHGPRRAVPGWASIWE